MKHYKKELSAYLHHELPKETRQKIAEHLLLCEQCRKEHDQIKLGAALAGKLERGDAPAKVWNEIKDTLDNRKYRPTFSLIQTARFFNGRGIFALSASALLVTGILALLIYNLFYYQPPLVATNTPSSTPAEQKPSPADKNLNENTANNTNLPVNSSPQRTNSNINPDQDNSNQEPTSTDSGWAVETLAGNLQKSQLAVGETLVTDADSRAKIQVADIGNVEVAPNSRVKLVKSEQTERRLSLEHGKLQAQIIAPPRLFIVDTPSAVAVDWGCAYTLEVDKGGNSKLHVTSGYVALERGGRESIVPAGAMALTKKGKGLGTPFSDSATKDFQTALYKFDFGGGGKESLDFILKNSRSYDTVTLWNLLSRVARNERERILDTIISFTKLPAGVTREGILDLDKNMLEKLRWELESLWFA